MVEPIVFFILVKKKIGNLCRKSGKINRPSNCLAPNDSNI